MIYFVSYDVANPKRLRRVSKTLENFGFRIQFSFFECEMESPQIEELKKSLLNILDLEEDSLLIYPLCQDCAAKTFSLGQGNIFIPSTFEIL